MNFHVPSIGKTMTFELNIAARDVSARFAVTPIGFA
jgi:hypothetical protein